MKPFARTHIRAAQTSFGRAIFTYDILRNNTIAPSILFTNVATKRTDSSLTAWTGYSSSTHTRQDAHDKGTASTTTAAAVPEGRCRSPRHKRRHDSSTVVHAWQRRPKRSRTPSSHVPEAAKSMTNNAPPAISTFLPHLTPPKRTPARLASPSESECTTIRALPFASNLTKTRRCPSFPSVAQWSVVRPAGRPAGQHPQQGLCNIFLCVSAKKKVYCVCSTKKVLVRAGPVSCQKIKKGYEYS